LLVAGGVNIAVCYFVARPVQGVGILLPGLVPAAVAAVLALIFAPGDAAPVAALSTITVRAKSGIGASVLCSENARLFHRRRAPAS
jgi:uncharacterized membrane protein